MNVYYNIRRWILKNIIPETVWPEFIKIENIEFKLRNTPYSYGIKKLLSSNPNSYEAPERIFCSYISEGNKVLEFGGSIGIITRFIREHVGSQGAILSVEASQNLTSYSKTWLEKLGNIKIVTAFAFPIYKKVPLSFKFDQSLGSLGSKVIMDSRIENRNDDANFFLEDAEKKHGFLADVFVCDIEGSERLLLEHELGWPKSIHTTIIELHPSIYGMETTLKIIEQIKKEGFFLCSSFQSVYVFKRHETTH